MLCPLTCSWTSALVHCLVLNLIPSACKLFYNVSALTLFHVVFLPSSCSLLVLNLIHGHLMLLFTVYGAELLIPSVCKLFYNVSALTLFHVLVLNALLLLHGHLLLFTVLVLNY